MSNMQKDRTRGIHFYNRADLSYGSGSTHPATISSNFSLQGSNQLSSQYRPPFAPNAFYTASITNQCFASPASIIDQA
ncbi:hypothetical protein Syun_017184 [Stephania yunnanensis]|uniref:Uncharacterized protein n=1 Tax=Stephania yunnanensis TaxID=152371 RepID=A0AAP0J8T0_9MAGN